MKKKIYLFVPIFLIVSLLLSGIYSISTAENISDKVFRLHILANSDEDFDQELKLKVRDEILETTSTIFSSSYSLENTISNVRNNMDLFSEVARNVIKENGYNYDVSVTLDKEYFSTRNYDSFIMPAGIYNSLKIIIGNGAGHNWWCVMYPSVCLSGATDDFSKSLSDEEIEYITDNKFIPKFKIVEIYEKIRSKIEINS